MACQTGINHELVLIDQSQFRQGQRKFQASYGQSPAGLLLEVMNGLSQITSY
jgi:hypothetical protein